MENSKVTWQHGCCADGACTTETCMALPFGATCGSCVHRSRCETFGYTDGPDTPSCSFFPSRYRAAKAVAS